MAFKGLFIGIDRYQSSSISELSFAKRDAIALSALFGDTLGGDITLLADADATTGGIRAAFESLAQGSADDTIVIAFSGHGTDDHRLVAYDTDMFDLENTSIRLDQLQALFERIPARRLVLILDCCFSGGIGAKVLKLEAQARDMLSTEARLGQLAGEGRVILTASAADEAAYENGRLGHGFLTNYLIEALRGADEVVEAGRLSLLRLLQHVIERVRAAAHRIGRPQTPTVRGTFDGDLLWPVFVVGDRFRAAFPEHVPAEVDADIESLAGAGFPGDLVEAWGAAIPSLNTLQIAAINEYSLLEGNHLVVSAPTSSGKTMIGELAALNGILRRKRALFLLPLKALVADKQRHFEAVYGRFGIRTIVATGETDDISPLLKGQYDVALLTYEKFAAIALTFPHVLEQVGTVVVDEAQMIADPGRGANLEFLLTLLRMRRSEGVEPQTIALSAVIGDTNGLEDWLGARLLRRTERPVPLDEGVLRSDGSFHYIDSETGEHKTAAPVIVPNWGKGSSQDYIIPLVRKLVGEGQQVIVFREMKGEARGCANYLAAALGLPAARDAIDRLPIADPSRASDALRACLMGGVAFHHSDLTADERRVVEEEFRRPDAGLRVIAATTTLAMGINTPASSVIIAGLDHPGSGGPTPYTVAEYKNLVGRAGRLGFAEKGTSYLLAMSPRDEHDLWHRYVMAAPENLVSRFVDGTDARSLIVRVIVSAGRAGAGVTQEEVIAFLEASFGAFQAARIQDGWQWSRADLAGSFEDLARHGLITTDDEGLLHLTDLGRVAGEGGAEVQSVLRIVDALSGLLPEDITDPVLITATQASVELDEVYFPINKKSTQKEPQVWTGELLGQGVQRSVLRVLHYGANEQHVPTLRAKKAVASLLFISGRPMAEIEQTLTQFGGRSDGAAGPIRGVAARTCDVLPVAARVAEVLHPDLNLGDRVARLAVRLTHGVTSAAVDLAREAGGRLTRGEYCEIVRAGLSIPADAVEAADDQLLPLVGNDATKLAVLREAASAAAERSRSLELARRPILDAYVP